MPQLNSSQVVPYILEHASSRPTVFYCTGPTLSGRTFICEELEACVNVKSSWHPRVYRYTGKQSDIGHEAVTSALKSFAEADGLTRRKLAKAVKDGWPGILKAVRAVASRFVPGVPSELDSLIDKLADAVKGSSDQKLKTFPQSTVNQLISLIRSAIAEFGDRGMLLIIDGVEEMPGRCPRNC